MLVDCDEIGRRIHPPRFTHGDCHAHQFFIATGNPDQPRISGVIDTKVSSAGDGCEDLIKLGIELAQVMPYDSRWWNPLFAGYGQEPDFGAFRLRLLGVAPNEFWLTGHWMQTSDRERQVQRFLKAANWEELFLPLI